MGRMRLAKFVLASGVCVALAAPAAAQGTITIGSNLLRAPNIGVSTAGLTLVNSTLESGSQAANGIVSPVNGTVVQFRIRSVGLTSSVAFRVVRPLGGDLFTGAGTSSIVSPPATATTAYPAQLPIAIGDRVGLDCCDPPGNYFVVSPGSDRLRFSPPLVDGAPGRTPSITNPDREIAINADIEPTSAFTVLKAKPKPAGKVQITATLPNPGTLAAGDKSASLATAAAGKKTKLLKRTSTTASAPGQVKLVVKATKVARSILARKGKLKAKLKLSFTPTGGTPSTQVRKVRLKS